MTTWRRRVWFPALCACWLAAVTVSPLWGYVVYGWNYYSVPAQRDRVLSGPAEGTRWVWFVRRGFARTEIYAQMTEYYPLPPGAPAPQPLHGRTDPAPWSQAREVYAPGVPLETVLIESAFGWPARMGGMRGMALPPLDEQGKPVLRQTSIGPVLDLRPAELHFWVWWPGVVFNIFVGPLALAAAWIGIRFLVEIRRTWRRSRGLCANCGYPVAGLATDVCPECGRELGVRRTS